MKKSNMGKNVLWNTVGNIFYSGCQWLMTVLVVYLATYKEAGILSLAMTTSSTFSAIALFGMRNYQISDVKHEYSPSEYVGSRITTTIAAFLCCLLGSIYGNSLYEIGCIMCFMLIRSGEAFIDVLQGEDQMHERFDLIGTSLILRGIITVAGFSAGLILSHDIFLTLLVTAIINFMIAIFIDFHRTKALEEIHPVLLNKHILLLLRDCAPIVVSSFLLSYENLFPKNELQIIEGMSSLGVYSTIASPTLVVQVLAQVVFVPFIPGLSALFDEGKYKDFQKAMNKTYAALVGFSIIILILARLLGKLFLRILFGKEILDHFDLFMPMILVTLLTGTVWILVAIVTALRKILTLTINMAVNFVLCLLLTKPFILKFSQNGVSFVQILTLSIYILQLICIIEFTVHKKKKEKNNA